MSESLVISEKEFIPAQRAGKVLGYTGDYLTKLIREEKIAGEKVGKSWYVDLDSARTFLEAMERNKLERNEAIRQERLLEQKRHKQSLAGERNKRRALMQAFVVLVFAVLTASGSYSVVNDANVFNSAARSLFAFIAPDEVSTVVVTETGTADVIATTTTTHTTILVAPDELWSDIDVAESFSDEVEISVDPDNPDMGVIIPVFRDRTGEPYRFLIMPVRESPTSKTNTAS